MDNEMNGWYAYRPINENGFSLYCIPDLSGEDGDVDENLSAAKFKTTFRTEGKCDMTIYSRTGHASYEDTEWLITVFTQDRQLIDYYALGATELHRIMKAIKPVIEVIKMALDLGFDD